jgi:hypothetical protein
MGTTTQDWLQQLQTPAEEKGALSDTERRQMFNLARRQSAGALNTGLSTLRSELGGHGFRGGESGIADSALANLVRSNQEALSQEGTKIAMDEAQRRERLAELGQNRLLGAGGLSAQLESIAAQRAAASGANKNAAAQLAWEKERFGQEFPWEQEQSRMTMLSNLLGEMGQSQQQVYAPYWDALGQ